MSNIATPKEIAQFLRLSEATIIKLTHEGQLPGFKIGDSWRFDMNDIMQQISGAKTVAQRGKANESKRGNKKCDKR